VEMEERPPWDATGVGGDSFYRKIYSFLPVSSS